MKLSNKFIELLSNTISTARLIGVDMFVIDNGMISGIDEDKTIFIFNKDARLPASEADIKVGFNRLDVLNSRFDMILKTPTHTIEAVEDTRNNSVSQLLMKNTNIAIDYRCANISTLKYPKNMYDEMTYSFEMNDAVYDQLLNSVNAMRCEKILFICSNDVLTFELTDETRDKCTIVTDILVRAENTTDFVFRYNMKKILLLLRKSDNSTVRIGAKGILSVTINNIPIYLIPQAQA